MGWGLLALALLAAQMLGQWHALAHPEGLAGPQAVAQQRPVPLADAAHSHDHAAQAGGLAGLFTGHHALDCRLLDHVASGAAPGFALAPWLPALPPTAQVALWRAPLVPAQPAAAFRARAPPARA